MPQDFKLKFDAMRQNNPAHEQGEESAEAGESYTFSTARNVCFIWADGRKHFLSYAYLIGAEYDPANKAITLSFTSHQITLKGFNLDKLFEDFMMHVPRKIVCSDPRYNATIDVDRDSIVNEIVSTAV